ncbi:MAG: HpaII family restriction endonuclease [Deinococcales bacterium]|nr:HpaII family restriction endonuclease [Chitinophagaceae bacterium]
MLTGNKGDWSEIYALFKLLGDKKLFAGDKDLNKIESLFYPIIKIIRKESGGNFEYELDGDLVIISGVEKELRIPIKKFSEQAIKLLEKIKGSKGVFGIPETQEFMNSVYCKTLKAVSSAKTDIRIVIHDQRINQTADLGFSIKSELGNDATILNAGETTNFVYQILGITLTENQIKIINAIDTKSKIKDRIIAIKNLGGTLSFSSVGKDVFKNNLVLIDSLLPNILAEVIKLFYTSTLNSTNDLTESINIANPLAYDTQFAHSFYGYKVKRFLTDVALGMMPSKVWTGVYDATGGYLIVKENGDVLCYHIYNRNKFEDYLFANTKLETASSTRHKFGKIYEKDGSYYFKLNLQIRFK